MQQFLCPLIIGRDEEIGALQAALAGASDGSGGLLLLTGDAGLGKSRLAKEAARLAAESHSVVLWGRAAPSPAPAPYRPFAEAILSALRASDLPLSAELDPYRPFLGHLVPEWRLTDPVEHSLVLVGEALLRLLRVLADHGACLMVLEDLQWADAESIAVLEYLADHLPSERVLCVATCRLEAASAATDTLRALSARRTATEIELSPLDEDEVKRMASACLATPELPESVLDEIVASAEGVPLLVEELLASWAAAGELLADDSGWTVRDSLSPTVPVTFADGIARRARMLGSDGLSVLQAAAVMGRRFDWSLIPAMTGLGERQVLKALRSCIDAQLVEVERDDQGAFRFRHALTRDAVLAMLLPPERAALADRALDILEENLGEDPERQALAAEIAAQATDATRAGRVLLAVGRDALRRAALKSAESALQRARSVAEGDRSLWVEAGETLVDVLASAGKLDQALDVAGPLLETTPAASPRAAELRLRLARAAVASERWETAREQLAGVRAAGDPALNARADAIAAEIAIASGDPVDAERLARAALDGADTLSLHEVACEALQVLGRCERLRDLDAARALFDRALEIATEHDLAVARMRALHERSTIEMLGSGDTSGVLATRWLAVDAGAPALSAVLDIQLAGSVSMTFHPDELMAVAARATDAARRLGLRRVLPMGLLYQAVAYAQRGRTRDMEELIAEALRDGDIEAETMASGWCRAVVALVNDDRAATLLHLDAAEELILRQDAPNPWGFRGLRALIRTVDGAGDVGARERLRSSGATVFWLNRACLEIADAVAAGRAGDPATAEGAFGRGDALLAPSPWIRHLVRRLVAEAALRDGWGQPVAWLRSAADFFGEHGYDRLRVACRSLLRRAGEPVPRRGRGDSAVPPELRELGVTSREVDVLGLIAERLGNAEIAQRLYLSPRTVEKHVGSLISKTGASDRRELAAYASRVLRH